MLGLAEQRILVIGATGFVGRAVVEHLVLQGAHITATTRRSSESSVPFSPHVEVVQCDLSQAHGIKQCATLVTQSDIIIYLAGFVPTQRDQSDDSSWSSIAINLNAALNTLRKVRPGCRACYISTVDVYGSPQYVPVSEDHLTHPSTFYAAGKLAAEKFLQVLADRTGFILSVVRLAHIYGPAEPHGKVITRFIQAVTQGLPPLLYGAGDDARDYLYITDAACGVVLVSTLGQGIYNIASGIGISVRELADKVIHVAGLRIVPEFRPVATVRVSRRLVLDVARARSELGFAPSVSLEEGLLRTLNWYAHRA